MKRHGSLGRLNRMRAFDYVNYAIMLLLSFLFLYPIWQTLMLSFSDSLKLVQQPVYFISAGFTIDPYRVLLSDNSIIRYYINTIVYAVSGTALTLVLCSFMAYPLTFRDFRGRRVISLFLTITLFLAGGMIPTYLVIRSYHMLDTIWALILPGAVSAYNVILFRTSFQAVPESLKESAYIDGAGHFRVLFYIVLPLSKAVLACIALFTIVGFWNGYLDALIYLDKGENMPIQIFLRRILVQMEYNEKDNIEKVMELQKSNPRTVKAAATILTILPILCVYPFLQKYFAKGVMVGSVKE